MSITLLVVRSGHEDRVSRDLERYGVFSFWLRQRVDGKLLPVWPRYLFAVVKPVLWQAINEVRDVFGFVKDGDGAPWIAPPGVIDTILAQADNSLVVKTDSDVRLPGARFKRGQRLRIVGKSSFAGCEVTYQFGVPPDRAVVELDMMGRMVRLAVAESELLKKVKRNSGRWRTWRPREDFVR